MQTGQSSIAPETSLPQLGQGALGLLVHVALTALQPQPEPKATPRSTEWCEKRPARPLANCCPVAQAIACSFILARKAGFGTKFLPCGSQTLAVELPSRAAYYLLKSTSWRNACVPSHLTGTKCDAWGKSHCCQCRAPSGG